MQTSAETIAAVDLGSNSFHLIVARTEADNFQVVDRMRRMVTLGGGLDAHNALTEQAIKRALDCLEQFGERIRDLPRGSVRVVGTNALRKARNADEFISQAEAALGHGIDVISGHEEARLIYLGVSHGLEDGAERRLVIDVGGGSTEFILGRHFDPTAMESLHMGCVSLSEGFFEDGLVTEARMCAAEIAARQELEPIEERYRRIGWQSVIGASGTILAIREIAAAQGWSKDGITPHALAKLREVLIEAGHVGKIVLEGLPEERRPVFPGGVAILNATFEALQIERMRVSNRALREGLLYDLLGRIHHEDVRERTIKALSERYQLDFEQAKRVNVTAQNLLAQVADTWDLAGENWRRLLRWATTLHEIGLTIAHSQYHKHGGYLLTYLEMPGFARGEQRRLAVLVRAHRRKAPLSEFNKLPAAETQRITRLSLILRLAVLAHRRRTRELSSPITLTAESALMKVKFPAGWLDAHPLTRADLELEATYLKSAGFKLKYK